MLPIHSVLLSHSGFCRYGKGLCKLNYTLLRGTEPSLTPMDTAVCPGLPMSDCWSEPRPGLGSGDRLRSQLPAEGTGPALKLQTSTLLPHHLAPLSLDSFQGLCNMFLPTLLKAKLTQGSVVGRILEPRKGSENRRTHRHSRSGTTITGGVRKGSSKPCRSCNSWHLSALPVHLPQLASGPGPALLTHLRSHPAWLLRRPHGLPFLPQAVH